MNNKQSKIEKLITKLCPDGVEYKELGKIGSFTRGSGLQKKDFTESGVGCIHYGQIYTYYGIYTDTTKSFVSKELANKLKKVNKNDLVIACTSENIEDVCKAVVWLGEEEIVTGGHSTIFNHDQNPMYMGYFFRTQYFFDQMKKFAKGTKVIEVSAKDLAKIKIPLPPLEIQKEIVTILNSFTALETELEAELETELEARISQYEHYRKKLLTPKSDGAKWMRLGDIAEYRRGSFPQPYGESRWYNGEHAMPFVQVADVDKKMSLVENTKRKISKLAQPMSVFVPKGTVLVTLQGSIGRVAITQYDCYVDRTLAIFEKFKIKINKKYFAYQLEKKFAIEKDSARGSTIKTITKEEFTKFKIPIPSLEEQNRVVTILDEYNALLNDISIDLPEELKARRTQYGYYRNKLLTFNEYAR